MRDKRGREARKELEIKIERGLGTRGEGYLKIKGIKGKRMEPI